MNVLLYDIAIVSYNYTYNSACENQAYMYACTKRFSLTYSTFCVSYMSTTSVNFTRLPIVVASYLVAAKVSYLGSSYC